MQICRHAPCPNSKVRRWPAAASSSTASEESTETPMPRATARRMASGFSIRARMCRRSGRIPCPRSHFSVSSHVPEAVSRAMTGSRSSNSSPASAGKNPPEAGGSGTVLAPWTRPPSAGCPPVPADCFAAPGSGLRSPAPWGRSVFPPQSAPLCAWRRGQTEARPAFPPDCGCGC